MALELRMNISFAEMAARVREKKDALPVLYQKIADSAEVALLPALQNAAPVRTGALEASITANQTSSGEGTSLQFTAGVPYAIFVLEGTRPHLIVPRDPNGVLAFIAESGDLVFTRHVNHPGTQPNPFPERAWENAKDQVITAAADAVREFISDL